jgi:drug/metabolite transporter (DMT)-like permease
MILGGFCGYIQSLASISFLSSVSPLTYSISNVLKRVFIIVTSILYFGNVVTPLNYLGILISIGGVLIYNKAKIDSDKNKKDKEVHIV